MLLDDRPHVAPRRLAEEAEALIKEARRRARRRRLKGVGVLLMLVLVGAFVYDVGFDSHSTGRAPFGPAPLADLRSFHGDGVLAFVSMGRLWVLDGAAGTLTAVSAPADQASDPQFSPDGRWLSYAVRLPSGASEIWLARANGSAPRQVAANTVPQANWLPDGRLLTGRWILRVAASGTVARVYATRQDISSVSPDGQDYAFASSNLVGYADQSSTGVSRLEVSSSIDGKRTTWYEDRISSAPKTGVHGDYVLDADTLPHREGILFQLDPDGSASLAADGLGLYEIKRAGARPVKLGVTVGVPLAIGPHGTFAITAGGNRYAWQTKSVETCMAATARCSPLRTKRGMLSFDPAWSRSSDTLALVEAPRSAATNFYQATMHHWYASHTLWVLRQGASVPTEISGTAGADVPTWSANGKSLLYEAGDALWLLPSLSSKPIRIAAPLFPPNDWPSYYGQINWGGQFAWLSPS
jgi:hypothetical protein